MLPGDSGPKINLKYMYRCGIWASDANEMVLFIVHY
jgi:hypothetical protein